MAACNRPTRRKNAEDLARELVDLRRARHRLKDERKKTSKQLKAAERTRARIRAKASRLTYENQETALALRKNAALQRETQRQQKQRKTRRLESETAEESQYLERQEEVEGSAEDIEQDAAGAEESES